MPDADEIAELEQRALAAEEAHDIDHLLAGIDRLPPDSKLGSLKDVLGELNEAGFAQTMVFTQFTDTMEFLREALRGEGGPRLMCFSGRGGEIPTAEGGWRRVGRDEAKRRFRDGEADVLLCTDAAAEGLNFQFCGALVNLHYEGHDRDRRAPGAAKRHRPVRDGGRTSPTDPGATAADHRRRGGLGRRPGGTGTRERDGRD